jgi:hypothetical protein
MELTGAQYERIKSALLGQRGNVRLSNLQVLNAVLYVAEQGCMWPNRGANGVVYRSVLAVDTPFI